ncbi:carbamoyltransferase [Maricurvus nonylphenolicus]|uniref:carbamoyltransferase family protein n=1 Tax=Maricurvus nonylphenolicus TaxID=1008307 RepID=UPI0036F1FF8F
MIVLGIHIGHDASASIVKDGVLSVSVEEERFTRVKHYGGMPIHAINHCLEYMKVKLSDVDSIAYSGHIGDRRFAQLLGLPQDEVFKKIEGIELGALKKVNLFVRETVKKTPQIPDYFHTIPFVDDTEIHYVSHHRGHAASAYYTSGNSERTLVVTADAAGEDGYSLSVSVGTQGNMKTLKSFKTDCSYGYFYGLVTEGLGWWVGDGEGTTMGLAPYGDPSKVPENELLQFMPIFENGEFVKSVDFGRIDGFEYMDTYHWHFHMVDKVKAVIDKYGRENVAAKAQELLEREMLTFLTYWKNETGCNQLAAAGGVFLNVKLNQKIVKNRVFDDLYVYPDAGDSGLSAGAALEVYFKKHSQTKVDRIKDIRLGPSFTDSEIQSILDERKVNYELSCNVCADVAKELHDGKIVAWFQGRAECGPRALGGRSILFDPTKAKNKDIVNKHVKFRQPFRPFCPSMTVESASTYLTDSSRVERYMITAYDVRGEMQETIPAVTHKDGTCRPQMIEKDVNPLFWELLNEYGSLSGVPVLMNTSFNIKGEPIVNCPRDAIKCFYDTGIDVLAIGNFILRKS